MVSATLDHGSSAATTVTVTAAALEPPIGTYFTRTGSSLTIAAGATRSTGSVTIAAVDDDIRGPPRRRVLVSGVATNERAVNGPAAAKLTITDDETVKARSSD